MKAVTTISLAALMFAVASPAIAADKETYKAETSIEKDAKGNYEKKVTEKSTDAMGTDVKNEAKTEVDVDRDGSKEVTVKTKSVKDPKGLMNKSTVETETHVKQDEHGNNTETTQKKKVDGKVVLDRSTSKE
ncbi:hypothetical protein GC177_08685 [bacterium]|nr:hypothetical protein [bacterium]